MSLCVSRVHVAPRASFAPRIRRWTRAPTPSPVPRGIIGRSNGNAVPIIPLPLRAFAFEAFAFAAQEVPEVPTEPTDAPLDAVLTEAGLLRFAA